MKNKELLIEALQDFDGQYEECITDYLSCPYYNNEDCSNNNLPVEKTGSFEWNENCKFCKMEWLLKEWKE